MSKGITKIQLAVAVAKAKRLEAVNCKNLILAGAGSLADSPMKKTITIVVEDAAKIISDRVKELDREIDEIQGNVPVYNERVEKGLIS